MSIDDYREKIAEKLQYDERWLNKLDDVNPGIYGVEDHEVDISSNDIWVNIQEGTFTFRGVGFSFTARLGSSGNDGHNESFKKVADGEGSFTYHQGNITIDDLNIEMDLQLF